MKIKSLYIFKSFGVLVLLITFCALNSSAQLKLPGAAYFLNQYYVNPAMAGHEQKLNINASYEKAWSDLPSSPVIMSATLDYGFKNNTGIGLNLVNDKAGILSRSKLMATYTYHAPLSEKHILHFGLSAGAAFDRLNTKDIIGEVNDPSIGNFNNNGTYFDADFGIAYSFNKKLYIQGVMPNMVSQFRKYTVELVDRSTYFASVSYKTNLAVGGGAEPLGIEPKICIRGIKDFENIVDIGANLSFAEELLQLSAMYHSTNAFTFGLGIQLKTKFSLLLNYSTRTEDLRNAASGAGLGAAIRVSL